LSDADISGPPVSEEEADYFRSIEERFCALRGAPMLLSPRDWNLIAGWWAEGVPLALVLESLEEVFTARRRREGEAGRVNSIAYAKPEILRRFHLRREMIAPRRGEQEEMSRLRLEVRRHLGRSARLLKEAALTQRERGREALACTLLIAAAEARRLRKECGSETWDPSESEQALERLDAEVLAAAEGSMDEAERGRIDREAEQALGAHRRTMRPEAFRESLAAMRGRLMRRGFEIPRLSLLGEG
jgi:hypothetical protein